MVSGYNKAELIYREHFNRCTNILFEFFSPMNVKTFGELDGCISMMYLKITFLLVHHVVQFNSRSIQLIAHVLFNEFILAYFTTVTMHLEHHKDFF